MCKSKEDTVKWVLYSVRRGGWLRCENGGVERELTRATYHVSRNEARSEAQRWDEPLVAQAVRVEITVELVEGLARKLAAQGYARTTDRGVLARVPPAMTGRQALLRAVRGLRLGAVVEVSENDAAAQYRRCYAEQEGMSITVGPEVWRELQMAEACNRTGVGGSSAP